MTVQDYIREEVPEMKEIVSKLAFKFHHDRNDIYQSAIVIAIRNSHKYKDSSKKSFFGWWYMIVRNLCIDEYRRNTKTINQLDISKGHYVMAENQNRFDDRENLINVYLSLRKEFGCKKTLVMYMLSQGYKYEEISTKLSIPRGTIKSIIHKCRNYLNEHTMK